MAGNLPPGCTQRECDEAQPGYWDALGDDNEPTELDLVYEELHRTREMLKRVRDWLTDADRISDITAFLNAGSIE